MIHVLTPLRQSETAVYDVAQQSVPCRRFVHTCELPNRRDNEALNRNSLRCYASEPYTVLMDADVVLTQRDTIAEMARFLDDYPLFGAVAVDTKGRADGQLARDSDVGHTIIALMMVRKEILTAVFFEHLVVATQDKALKSRIHMREYPEHDACLCSNVNLQIRTMTGVKIPYLKGVKAVEV